MDIQNLFVTAKLKVWRRVPEAPTLELQWNWANQRAARLPRPASSFLRPTTRRQSFLQLFLLLPLLLFFSFPQTQDHQLKSSLPATLLLDHCTSDSDECVEKNLLPASKTIITRALQLHDAVMTCMTGQSHAFRLRTVMILDCIWCTGRIVPACVAYCNALSRSINGAFDCSVYAPAPLFPCDELYDTTYSGNPMYSTACKSSYQGCLLVELEVQRHCLIAETRLKMALSVLSGHGY